MTFEFTGEGSAPFSEPPGKQASLDEVFNRGFAVLPKLYSGDLHERFEYDFPFSIQSPGRRLLQTITRKQAPQVSHVKLDKLVGLKQRTDSDCVGAVAMSVFSTITGVTVTPEIYENFLQTALHHGLAVKEDQGIKVFPFALNLLMTPDFRNKFNSDVKVAYRNNLSSADLSVIAESAKQKSSYKTFILLPMSSVNLPGQGHLVALQEISPDGMTVYDPKIGEEQTLSNEELERRRKFSENGAIFIFSKRQSVVK